jgi:hypothetical protein
MSTERPAIAASLLGCIGQHPENSAGGVEHLSAAEWRELAAFATWHRVAPLLYHKLRERGLDGLCPEPVLELLRETYRQNALRNLRLYHELGSILAALAEVGIPAIVLKGGFLAQAVYQDDALRPMLDLDLLIRKEHLSKARDILLGLNFRERARSVAEPRSTAFHHLPRLIKHGGTVVELHWTIVNPTTRAKEVSCPFDLRPEDLWERAIPFDAAGTGALALCVEDLLLHLCLHLTYEHRLEFGLLGLCDVSETIRHCHGSLDWETLDRRAGRWGAMRCAYLSLRLARDLLGADVPDEVLATLEPDDVDPQLLVWARDQIVGGRSSALPPLYNLARPRGDHSIRQRALSYLRTIFPPREYMASLYSVPDTSRRVCLCYLARLGHLARRYFRVVWKMLRRDEAVTTEIEHEERIRAMTDWLSCG